MYKGPLVAPCPARTRSLTGRARRAPSKDPASIKGPSSLKELLLKPGTLYCIGPRGGGFARLSVARPTRTRDGRPALSLCSLSPCMYIYIYVCVYLPSGRRSLFPFTFRLSYIFASFLLASLGITQTVTQRLN